MVAVKEKVVVTTIGQYLLDRLYAMGVRHIFGVPGDYVLRFDKIIEQCPIKFINTTRETTAGYAADAYGRMMGLGVACITYGVGINIVNPLSQAYVESSPLVVISGAAGTDEFTNNPLLHHLINKSHTTHADTTQLEMFKYVTIDQGVLDDPKTAAATIDRVLDACVRHQRPVYIEIPRNYVDAVIELPKTPSAIEESYKDLEALAESLEETKKMLASSKNPVIWAGHEILRFGLSEPLLKFAEEHRIPIVSSMLGKTVVDEHHPLFAGVYQGAMSTREVIDFVQQCDCALILGVTMSDVDTGIFTAKVDQERRLIATTEMLNIAHHYYHDVSLADFIQGLAKIQIRHAHSAIHTPKSHRLPKFFKPVPGAETTMKRVFECIQANLQPENLLITDVGDCMFASADLVLHQNSFIGCAYFVSLGFATPAAIGAQMALPDRRVIAIVGDGGFQMTSMELSTAVRYGLDPIIIVLNNHGYGTERQILEGSYNDIADWHYSEIPRVLGGGIGVRVTTEEEFDKALRKAQEKRGTFHLIEVEISQTDFSPALQRLGEMLAAKVKSR